MKANPWQELSRMINKGSFELPNKILIEASSVS